MLTIHSFSVDPANLLCVSGTLELDVSIQIDSSNLKMVVSSVEVSLSSNCLAEFRPKANFDQPKFLEKSHNLI